MNAPAASRLTPFDMPTLQRPRDRSEERQARAAELREHVAGEHREGYEAGRLEGLAAAATETAEVVAAHHEAIARLHRAVSSLDAAAAELEHRDAVTIAEVERAAIELAVELAAELVGRELTVTQQPVLDALHRSAALLPARGTPVVRVHPDDAATVEEAVLDDAGRWSAEVSVLADASVEPGGCVVEVGPCRINGQIGNALDRMRTTLVGSP